MLACVPIRSVCMYTLARGPNLVDIEIHGNGWKKYECSIRDVIATNGTLDMFLHLRATCCAYILAGIAEYLCENITPLTRLDIHVLWNP